MEIKTQAIQVGKVQFVTTDKPLTFDGMDSRSRRLLCAVAVGWALCEPVASVGVLATCGRVAIAAVEPIQNADPILPVVLANVGGDWRGHLNNWYYHQIQWQDQRRRGDWRREWLREGRAILSRLLAHVRPCLALDEGQFLALELAAALVVPDEPG